MASLSTGAPECIYSKKTLSYSNGWVATQKWKMLHANVNAFVLASAMTPFPGTTNLRPQQFDVEPLADQQVVILADGSAEWELVTISFALDFLDVPWPGNIPRPTYPAGTTLKLQAKASGQFLMLPAAALAPKIDTRSSIIVNGNAIPNPNFGKAVAGAGNQAQENARVYIPLIDFILEWDRIPSGTSLTYSGLIGGVNHAAFMGAEKGVLLCEGVALDPTYTLNPSNPHAHKVVITLKARRISVGANVYGWNHDYKVGQGWTEIQLDDGAGNKTPRYEECDFTTLLTFG